MCIGGNDAAEQAAQARREEAERQRRLEEERQQRIAQGREQIGQTFSQFDDDFYSGIEDSYADYYMPRIEDQYNDARQNLILSLSRNGNLQSSAGARSLQDLKEDYHEQQGYYGDQAVSAAQSARAKTAQAKADLFQQLESSANPQAAAQAAAAKAQSIQQPPAMSPLGQLFQDVGNQAATAVSAEKSGYRGWQLGLPAQPAAGKAKVIQ